MKTSVIELPAVVTRAKWLAARLELLTKEKELTRRRDALNAERRRLPMVRIEKGYVFGGPNGKTSLLELFEGRLQLIIYHFMWLWNAGKPRDEGCPSCSGLDRPHLQRAPDASSRSRHYPRPRLAGATVQDRAFQEAHGLDLAVVFVTRQRLQL